MPYFIVFMKDGGTIRFDKKCTFVNIFNDHPELLEFKDQAFGITLAIIPTDNIFTVRRMED